MKAKKFQISLFLVLAALFVNTALVFAYPAEPPDKAPSPQTQTASHCAAITARAARVDIPTSRADYAASDQLLACQVVAGLNTVPVTGSRSDSGRQRYEEFKTLQAERMGE